MEGIPVTLIVKAPNQQIEDQTIQCELSWTISKLKGYLSEVYPSKPRTEEQKIIYSGQLLNDNTVLKDVLRYYDDENTNIHTMHLVCLPKKYAAPTQSSKEHSASNEGLRRRIVPESDTSDSRAATQESVTESSQRDRLTADNVPNYETPWNTHWAHYISQNPQALNYAYAPVTDPSVPYQWNQDPRFMPPQLMAQLQMNAGAPVNNQYVWMQHMYMQCMQQYNQMLANGGYPHMQYPYQYTQMPQTQQNTYEPQVEPPQAAGEAPEPRAANAHAANAQAANARAEDDAHEAQQPRDWLEKIYIMLRWAVLFLIIYFYSSPVRFALVLSLGFIIYIYHTGFFRPIPVRIMMPHERAEAERQANAPEPNVPDANATPQDEEAESGNAAADAQNDNAEQQNANAEPRPENAPAPTVESRTEPENANDADNRNTLLSTTWTIFTSFFMSLIPEAPNAL